MGDEASVIATEQGLRVFLSYSRKDADFVRRLADALTSQGFLADFDRSSHDKDNVETGISAEDDWWRRLQEMILAADVMVFVVSPDSAASRICDEEIAYARALSKRVIAILRRPIDFAAAPPRLAALNVKIDASADDDAPFEIFIAQLSTALARDVAWLREQTRLSQAAADWERSGQREDELLHGAEIGEAETWLSRKPPGVTELPEQIVVYLNASRAMQAERDERARKSLARQRRLQTGIGVAIMIALLVTVAGGVFVLDRQRYLSRLQSLTLARTAQAYLERQQFASALRLAVLAARDTFLSPASREARFALAQAAASPLTAQFSSHEGRVDGVVYSDSEQRLLTWDESGAVRIWDLRSSAQVRRIDMGSIHGGRFFAHDTKVIVWGDNGVRILGADGPAGDAPPMQFDAAVYNVGLTPDESLALIAVGSNAADDRGKRRLFVRRLSDANDHVAPIPFEEMIGDFFFTHDGRRVLVWSRGIAQMYDVATMTPVGAVMRHDGEIAGARLSPDDTRVLTFSWSMNGRSDNSARLWDAATGRPVAPPLLHQGAILNAKFSPDARRFVTLGLDAVARVWDAATGASVTGPLVHPALADPDVWTRLNRGVQDADFSPDGRILATSGHDHAVRVWNLEGGGAPAKTIDAGGIVYSVRFSADGASLSTLTAGGGLTTWDVQTGFAQGPTIETDASRIELTRSRTRAATWSNEGVVSVWTLENDRPRAPAMNHGAIVVDATWIDDDEFMARSGDDRIRFWNSDDGSEIGAPIMQQAMLGASVSPDRSRILSWSEAGQALQWDRRTHARVDAPIEVGAPVVHALYVGGRERIATIDQGAQLALWNAETGARVGPGARIPRSISAFLLANIPGYYDLLSMYDLTASPDGKRILAWANADGAVLMDAETGEQIGRPMLHENIVTGATFSHSGALIATWSGQTITGREENSVRLWNADTSAHGAPLASEDAVRGAIFSPDDRTLVVWNNAGQIAIHDLVSGAPPKVSQHVLMREDDKEVVQGAAFMPDGSLVYSWGEEGVRFWNPRTGEVIGRPLLHPARVSDAQLSADGRYMLTIAFTDEREPRIRIWDVERRALIIEQGRGVGVIWGGGWTPTGDAALTWGEAGAPQIWPQAWMQHTGNLNDWARYVCEQNLVGDVVERQTIDGLRAVGIRRISAEDTDLAPIIRGREGEDVCAWSPTWYDRVLDSLFGWIRLE